MSRSLLLIALTALSFSFVTKTKKFVPPGTVQITETFFADETEISNHSWGEYEFWTKTKYGANSPEHLATLPDTLVWHGGYYNDAYVKHYYRHPAYKDFPVVGISYEQALAFCKWRTERVKEYFAIRNKQAIALEYTLPSKNEWELLSNNGPGIFSNNGMDAKGRIQLNCARQSDTLETRYADATAPVYSYWKNRFGLFNTIGNVSEMVLEKGLSKGGSWHHELESCRPGKDIAYEKPEAWLGFRCVCVVKAEG